MDKCHPVNMLSQVREDLGHELAALTSTRELERRLQQSADLLREESGELVKARELLPMTLGEFWLVVPGVHMAGTAIDEEPNHALRFGSEVRQAGRHRIERAVPDGRSSKQPLVSEDARKAEHSKAHSATAEQRAARNHRLAARYLFLHTSHRM